MVALPACKAREVVIWRGVVRLDGRGLLIRRFSFFKAPKRYQQIAVVVVPCNALRIEIKRSFRFRLGIFHPAHQAQQYREIVVRAAPTRIDRDCLAEHSSTLQGVPSRATQCQVD